MHRRRLVDVSVREPGRQYPGHEADQPIEHELERARIRTARAIEQFRRRKADGTDDQHPDHVTDARQVKQDVVDRADHQRRHDAEQIAVLQRPGEGREELADLPQAGLGPVPRRPRGREQQQQAAKERADGCEDQIAFHGRPASFSYSVIAALGKVELPRSTNIDLSKSERKVSYFADAASRANSEIRISFESVLPSCVEKWRALVGKSAATSYQFQPTVVD
jgi:hypothetical protein